MKVNIFINLQLGLLSAVSTCPMIIYTYQLSRTFSMRVSVLPVALGAATHFIMMCFLNNDDNNNSQTVSYK